LQILGTGLDDHHCWKATYGDQERRQQPFDDGDTGAELAPAPVSAASKNSRSIVSTFCRFTRFSTIGDDGEQPGDCSSSRVIVERLEGGDVACAIEAMHLDTDAFAKLELAIAEAYNIGGVAMVENMPRVSDPEGNRVVFRFGVRNPEAEAWLRVQSSALVTRIVDDQRELSARR